MNFLNYLVLLYIPFIVCDKIDIGVILYNDPTISTVLKAEIKAYCESQDTKFKFDDTLNYHEAVNEDKTTVDGYFKDLYEKGVSYIYCYLPNMNPEELNEIAANYSIPTINIAPSPHTTCLTHVAYGFDSCYSKFLAIDSLKSRNRYNIVIGKENECTLGIIEYLVQFSTPANLSFTFSTTTTPSANDIENHFKKVYEDIGNTKVYIYNFVPDKIDDIKNAIYTAGLAYASLINFDVDRKKVFSNLANYEGQLMVGEFFDFNNSDPNIINKFKITTTPHIFHTEELWLFYMLELYSSVLMSTSVTSQEIINFELYDKKITISDYTISLLHNNHLISDVDIVMIRPNSKFIKIAAVEVQYQVPIAQIIGSPKNTTCNVLHTPSLEGVDALFIGISFSGDGNSGYLTSHTLVSLLTAIDYVNRNSPLMGKQIVPIFISADLPDEEYIAKFYQQSSMFKILCTFVNVDIEIIDVFSRSFSDLNIVYIQLGTIGGEFCNSRIMNGNLPISSFLTRATINIFSEFEKVFILSSNTMASRQAVEAMNYITNLQNVNVVGSYQMISADDIPGQNACTTILNNCESSLCLIVDLADSQYQESFFSNYYRKNMSSNIYPVLVFNLDERLISMSNKDYYEGAYVMSYYFDTMKTDDSEKLRQMLTKLYGNNAIITANMAVAYSQIFLLKNAVNVIYSTDMDQLKSVMGYVSYNGPGGIISWTSEGFASSTVELGIVQDGKINKVDSGVYMDNSHSYLDFRKQCDWINDDIITNRPIYKVIFLNVIDSYTKDYNQYYHQYFSLMVNVMNQNYNGINGRYIIGIKPYLNSINDLVEFVRDKGNDDDIIAFIGTRTNKEREAIQQYLVDYEKLLFVVFPFEGEYSHSNVINIGYIPSNYVDVVIGYHYYTLNDFIIIYDETDSPNPIIVNTIEKTLKHTTARYEKIKYRPDRDNITEIVDYIKTNYTDGASILTLIHKNVEILLKEIYEQGLNSDNNDDNDNNYPVTMLDILFAFVADATNSTIYKGHYFIGSYTYKEEDDENTIMVDFLKATYGSPKILSTQESMNIYAALRFLQSAIESSNSVEIKTIKDEIYRTTLDLPQGKKISISSTNMATSGMHLFQCDGENDYNVILESPGLSDPFPLSRNDDTVNSIQYTYDYSLNSQKRVAEVYAIGLLIDKSVDDIYFLLNRYVEKMNGEGGNNGKKYMLFQMYCDQYLELQMFIERDDVEVLISNCDSQLFVNFDGSLGRNGLIAFSLSSEDSNFCLNNTYFTGTSPSQRTVSMLQYTISHYSSNFMVILPLTMNNTAEYTILMDQIDSYGGKSYVYFINETDYSNSTTQRVQDIISSVTLLFPTEAVILNYLNINEELNIEVYKSLYTLLSPKYNNSETSKPYSNDYVIITTNVDLFVKVPSQYREGHLCRIYAYADESNSPEIYEIGLDSYGKDFILNELEFTFLATFDLLISSLVGRKASVSLSNTLKGNTFTTSYGDIKVSIDNYVQFPMFLLESGSNGKIVVKDKLYDEYPSDTFRQYYNIWSAYQVCSYGSSATYIPAVLMLLLPLNGEYIMRGYDLLVSYSIVIDYLNNDTNRNRFYSSFICNVGSDSNLAIKCIKEMVRNYNTRVAFGIVSSEMRMEISKTLEEEDVLLYYPLEYEGLECNRHIVYTGLPYSVYTAFVPFLTTTLNEQMFFLYTTSKKSKTVYEYVVKEINERGFDTFSYLEVQTEKYNITNILNYITNKMKSGVIVSLLVEKTAKEFMLEFCKNGFTSNDYKIVNMFLYGKDIMNNYECYNGHYFWESMYNINEEIENKNSNYTLLLDKKYTQYSESTTLVSGAIISVLLNHYAFNEMNYIPSAEYPDNYTFDELIQAVYKSKIMEFSQVKITYSNHLTSSLALNQVIFNSTTNQYEEKIVYNMINDKSTNPYGLEFLSFSDNHYYVCNWNKYNNTSKYEEDVLLVALCLSVSGSLKEVEYQGIDPIISCIYDINDKGGIHGKYIIYRIYDTKSDKDEAVRVSQKVVEDNAALIIGGYSSDIHYAMSDYLFQYNKTIWFPGAFEGQECRKNVYYTGPVSNQFTDGIVNYLTKESKMEKNIMLLGDDRIWANTIFTIIKNKIEANGYNIYYYSIPSFSEVENAVKEGLAKMKNGGSIITSYSSTDFINIVNYMEQNITFSGKYELIAVSGDKDIINELSVSGKFDVILTASHFDENRVVYPELKERIFQYTSTKDLSMFGESCAIAFLLWASALEKAPTVLLDYDLNQYLYGLSVNVCDGPVKMNTNHYTSLYVSLGKMIPNKHSVEMVMIQKTAQSPMAWSWEIPETYGKVCDYNSSIGEIGELNAITILLGISQSGVKINNDVGIKSIIELIVMNINDEGGLLNKQLYLSTIDITSDDIECSTLIKKQLTSTKYDLLVTTGGSGCLDAITSITQELDIPVISLGYNGGENCVKNIIYASREPSTIDRLINVHLKVSKANTMIYSVIYTTEVNSVAMFEYAQKFIDFKKVELAYFEAVEPDQTDFDNTLNFVKTNCPDGCTILFFGTSINHKGLDKYYREKSMTIDKYPILSYTTGEYMLNSKVSPFYSGQSYFTSIESDNNKEFIKLVKSYTDEQITEVMENTYSILIMWINGVRTSKVTNSTIVIPNMYNVEYESAEGKISLKPNNYLSHYFYIGTLTEDSSMFNIFYTSSKAITPVAWKTFINSGSYTCDFSLDSIGSYQKDMSCTVGILNSFSGKFMTTERAMSDGIIQAINEINENGGVLQRKILIEIRDPQSLDEKYLDYAKELGKLDEVKAVFGTGRYATEKKLAPIFDKFMKPFFYPGNSAGEFCSAYVFSLQSTTNQLTHGLEKFEFSRWNEYVVVQVPTNPYSTISTRSILTRLTIFESTIHGPYNTTDFSKMDELSDEVLKRSNIILSVGADGIPGSLGYFCNQRHLNARALHIVVTTLDQRILDQLDEECVEGLYFLSTFMTEMGISTSAKGTFIESAEEFVTNMQDSYGSTVQLSAAMEAGYTAVKLWADVVENTYSFDIEKARAKLYGYLYRSATGDLEMNVNGFASRIIYYGVVVEKKSINILNYAKTPEEAQAYDQYLPENVGYTCDWTDEGDKHKLDSIKVIFLHEANQQESEIPIMLEEGAMIKEINYNKINGYNIITEFIFGNSSEDFDYKLSQYDEDEEAVVYFGCRSIECREMAIKHSEKTGKIFYNLGITEGNYCNKNVINIGTTAYQRISLILKYAFTQSINLFYFIGDDTDVDRIDYNVANHYLKQNQSQNLRSSYVTDKVITSNTVKTIMDKVMKYSENQRVAIIFTLKGERAITFLNYVVESNYLAREVVFLFVEYRYHDYNSFDLSPFSGSYVSVSFHPILQAALPQSYISDTQSNIGINTDITEEVESVKIVLDLWQQSMITSASDSSKPIPPVNYMMVNTVGISKSVPSGISYIEDNSYSKRSMYVLEITTNGDLNQIEPYRDSATIDVDPNPYYFSSIPSECKFGKQDVYFTYDNTLTIIFWLLLAIAECGGLFCMIFTIGNQNKLIIRSFGRIYNYILAFLLIITPLSAIPIAIPPSENNGICMARPLILGLCVKMILMTMLAKASKLYKKLRVTRTAMVTKTHISSLRIVSCLLIAISIETVIHLLWRYIDPNEFMSVYSQKYSSYFEEVYIRECSISTPFIAVELTIDGIMCLCLLFYSYEARNIANEFNDSLSLFLSSIITTILGFVLVALDFNINNEPDSVLIFRGIGIQINVIILCILQFGLNLYINENAGRNTSSGSAVDGKNKTVMSTTSRGYSQSLLKSSTMSMTMSHGRFTTNTLKTMTTQQKV